MSVQMRKSKKLREEAFNKRPKIGVGKKIILALPVLLSVSWIFYLQYGPKDYGGELLSPANTMPLVIALIIFVVGYMLFLLLMFSEGVEKFLWRLIRH